MANSLLRVFQNKLQDIYNLKSYSSRFINVRLYNDNKFIPYSNSFKNNKKRYVVDDKSDGFLKTRMIKYIGMTNVKDYNINKSKIKYSEFFPITCPDTLLENISNVEIAEISTLINFLYNYRISAVKQNVFSTTNVVDKECCKKLFKMEPKIIFNILYSFMFLMPENITSLRFYEYSMRKLQREMKNLSKRYLTQYCFYLGLSKQTKPEFTAYFNEVLDVISTKYMEELSVDDQCIIANAAFKMSAQFGNNDLLTKISETLKNSLMQTELDVAYLVTFIKILRLSRYRDSSLLEALSQVLIDSNGKVLNFKAACHTLAFYADSLFQEDDALNILITNCINDLNNTEILNSPLNATGSIRTKDISRFLWALGYLGYNLEEGVLENIENVILQRYQNGEYEGCLEDLYDTCLSLCIMNYTPEKLIPIILSERHMKMNFNRARFEARKSLFITCLNIENPALLNEIPYMDKSVEKVMGQFFSGEAYIFNRSGVRNIFNMLNQMDTLKLDNLKIECQIPNLGVAGIVAEVGDELETINIEVLDDGVCFTNKTDKPHGLMQLKLRLLKKLNVPTLILHNKDIESLSKEELMDYLKQKIEDFIETPPVDVRNKI